MLGWSPTLVSKLHISTCMSHKPVKIAPWLDATQLEEAIEHAALPLPRKEPWKYTSLKRVLERLESPFDCIENPPTLQGKGVSIGDCCDSSVTLLAREYLGQIDTGVNNVLTTFNLLHAQQAYVINSQATDESTVPIVSIPPSESCERVLIVVQANANLEVIEHTTGGNRVIECVLFPGANLLHRRLQPATATIEYNALTVQVKEQSSYKLVQYSVGAQLRRNDINVNIEGDGANVNISGGWNLTGTSHLDTQLAVNHLAKGATSHQKFHGVVGDSGRAIFNGRIFIARNAPQTDAHLQNKNIAISDSASIYTKPELEIYADDVICSHGATSGQLDEQQIFYLKSRGISDTKSRELILDGFLMEIVEDEDGARVLGITHHQNGQ